MSEIAYKLVDQAGWREALDRGEYAGSAVDKADGYIHMSTAAQLAETARRHYSGRDALMLVTVQLDILGPALKWEPSRGGDLFPHLYGPLPIAAAVGTRRLSVDRTGVMRFEDGRIGWP